MTDYYLKGVPITHCNSLNYTWPNGFSRSNRNRSFSGKGAAYYKVRRLLKYVSWKERKQLASDPRCIYSAPTRLEAEQALDHFVEHWDSKFPSISQFWRRDWDRLTPFFSYPYDMRKAIYTTNAIESLNKTSAKIETYKFIS